MKAGKWFGLKAGIEQNKDLKKPIKEFYSLTATSNNGIIVNFNNYRGKKVLLVNTASDCGYTNQFHELKTLHELYLGRLIILGFPANDFMEQEKGTDLEIASFCLATFGIQFMLMKKSKVVKGEDQNEVYKWLTNKTLNGWNDKAPEWNFSKYLINEEGILTHYFGPGISPLSDDVRKNLG